MNLIDFIPPKRYTDNQQPEAIGKETLDRKNLI